MKQQRSSGSSQDRQKNNKSSVLLSPEENELVFSLLGRKCLSMCCCVAQLYTTEPPLHSQWLKRYTGALCFVKDSAKRSYFCRIYCLMRSELVWEQEMYDTIEIHQLKPYLLAFEGQDNMVALNFAFEEEADNFFNTTTTVILNRNRRREDRRTRVKRNPPPRPTTAAPVPHTNNEEESSVILRNPPLITSAVPVPTVPPQTPSFSSISEKKRATRKLTKADIGMPTNFKHLTHVGWSAQRGFDLTGDDVETLKPFLQKAGVSDQQLKDRETRAFIYDFIQNHNVLESVKSEGDPTKVTKGQTPPPVPTRNQHQTQNGTQRTAPPPPPTRQQAPAPPPLPTTTPPSRGPPPSRPPPITNSSSIAAPPPPPPPPIAAMSPPPPPMANLDLTSKSNLNVTDGPDPRKDLMDSIRKGRTLKKVDQISNSSAEGGEDTRNDLLSEIRQGIALRPASTRELSTTINRESGATDALADALRRALLERGRVIRSSDEDSDDSSENDGEWDD